MSHRSAGRCCAFSLAKRTCPTNRQMHHCLRRSRRGRSPFGSSAPLRADSRALDRPLEAGEAIFLENKMDRSTEKLMTIERNPMRVRVVFSSRVIADTTRALTLKETGLPPVQYIPRADADMSLLQRTMHKSHCGYKGDAAYYTIRTDE